MGRMVRCEDTGNQQCEFIARGDSDDQIMLDIAHHSKTVHGVDELPADAQERIRKLIGEE